MSDAPDFVVRPAVPADAPAVAHVHVEGWRWAYAGIVPQAALDALSEETRAARWRASLDAPRPGWSLAVAEDARGVFGFASAGACRDADLADAGEITAIYLLRDRRGIGAGRALIGAAFEALPPERRARVALWVLEANTLARRFYERAGFTLDGTPAGRKAVTLGGATLVEVRYLRAGP